MAAGASGEEQEQSEMTSDVFRLRRIEANKPKGKFDLHAAMSAFPPISAESAEEPEQEILRNQFYCINGNSGWAWMVEYMPSYDGLPRVVRERLQQSPYNICTACLSSCLPLKTRHKTGRRADDLLMCIEIREHQIRSGQS